MSLRSRGIRMTLEDLGNLGQLVEGGVVLVGGIVLEFATAILEDGHG